MSKLKKLQYVKALHLEHTDITDKGLKELSGMRQLMEINLDGTKVSDKGIDMLQRALPKLKIYR